MIKTDKNSYIYIFAITMSLVLATILSLSATLLKPYKQKHLRQEKMQNILQSVGINVDRTQAEVLYQELIKKEIVLDEKGNILKNQRAFDVALIDEMSKPLEEQRFPLYIAEVEDQYYYIIPLRGAGLWDAIWGYVALEDDLNKIKGAVFDHKAETPGLGAEITKPFFTEAFKGKKIFERDQGKFVGVIVAKEGRSPYAAEHTVDAISGATITGDGVSAMINERLAHYLDFFSRIQEKQAISSNEYLLKLE